MYTKCNIEKIDKNFKKEMEELSVYVRKEKIEKPKIKFFKVKGREFQYLLIDENGFNFLKDNYPLFLNELIQIKKSETNRSMIWDGEEVDIIINEEDYSIEYINSKNQIIDKKPIGEKCLGIDKFGNLTFWDTQKQIIIHQKSFLGSSGNMYSKQKRIKLKKKELDKVFSDFYFKITNGVFHNK